MRGLKFPREFYVPKGAVIVRDKASEAVAYVYTGSKAGREVFGAVGFVGKGQKPVFHYTFRDAARRETYVREYFAGQQARKASRDARAAERKAWVHDYKVGDVFRTSWGYEQTNVEYFQVTEVKGKHLILREIGQTREVTGFEQGTCKPAVGQFLSPRYEGDDQGKPIRRLAQQGGVKIDDVRTGWLVKPNADGEYGSVRWSSYH